MSRRQRLILEPESEPDIRRADFSTLTQPPKKRGRPRTRVPERPHTTTSPQHTPQPQKFDENVPLPRYAGDPTQEEIDENIRNYVYTQGKSQNDYLREWLPRRVGQLQVLLEMEGRNNPTGVCEVCTAAEQGVWRCRNCVGGQMLCGICLCKGHKLQPYHRLQKWTGMFFRDASLWEVGVQICLGHKGNPCPHSVRDPAQLANQYGNSSDPAAAASIDPFMETTDEEVPEEDPTGDADDEDDVFEELAETPVDQPKAPQVDTFGNGFISIIDVTGVHYLPVVECSCNGSTADIVEDYIRVGLYPASFHTIRTAFTDAVLRDFCLSNLECKTSAYQYYQKLRRLTSPAFPKTVLNRYRELRRLSRQYRNMKLWKIHGKIYNEILNSGDSTMDSPPLPTSMDVRGSLALFCAACPQPGINLPDDWKLDPDRKLYIRSLVADGNFKADQLNQKNADDDVHLTNGEAFMTAIIPYQAHLREAERLAPRYKQEATCNNHRANADAEKGVLGKRIRGVGAHACARHGCFCPSSVVDFTKGEKQMHMDWSLVQAIATTHMDEIVRLLHIYDVNCQYAVHLLRRLGESSHMTIPELLEIVSGIGLFHVHGHKDECLYQYATTYIPDVANIDGEVMETLWAVLNLVSPSTRGATIAHRTEVLDDHMGDSNWKKIINTAVTIGKRFLRAIKEELASREYLEDVEAAVPLRLRLIWKRDIEAAEHSRDRDVKVMDLMKSQNKKKLGRKDIELELGKKELKQRDKTGSAAWISDGLQLEQDQLELRAFTRKLGLTPTRAQKLDLLKKRRRIRNRVEKHISTAATFLDVHTMNHLSHDDSVIMDIDPMDDELPDAENTTITRADPERQRLPFPSAVKPTFRDSLPPESKARLEGFMNVELGLRKGQANDCLQSIRNDLIQLSWQYKNDVRVNRSQATKNRAWAGVKLLTDHWRVQRQLYLINRFAMLSCADEASVEHDYPFLALGDCVPSSVLVAPNTPGQSSRKLNWLWRGVGSADGDLEKNDYALEFWRVNWLTSRAIHNRWTEEIQLTRKEMEWTPRFYMHMAQKWAAWQDRSSLFSEGHAAYAAKKVHMWNELGRVAQEHFDKLTTI